MKKQKKQFLTIMLAPLLCLCTVMISCDSTNGNGSVTFIRLRYESNAIPGDRLNKYLSAETLTFTANVQVEGRASKDFRLTSSNTGVATASGTTVTLVSGGQTTITATAAADSKQTHTIMLTVVNDTPVPGLAPPRLITNNFGQDSSAELLALWHHDADITEQKLQIVSVKVR